MTYPGRLPHCAHPGCTKMPIVLAYDWQTNQYADYCTEHHQSTFCSDRTHADIPAMRAQLIRLRAIRDAASLAHSQWRAYQQACETEPYATSEWVSGEWGNLEENMDALGVALAAYDELEQGGGGL